MSNACVVICRTTSKGGFDEFRVEVCDPSLLKLLEVRGNAFHYISIYGKSKVYLKLNQALEAAQQMAKETNLPFTFVELPVAFDAYMGNFWAHFWEYGRPSFDTAEANLAVILETIEYYNDVRRQRGDLFVKLKHQKGEIAYQTKHLSNELHGQT